MFKKFTITDKLLFVSALSSLVFSEVLFFQGEKQDAILPWLVGSIHSGIWNLSETYKQHKK